MFTLNGFKVRKNILVSYCYSADSGLADNVWRVTGYDSDRLFGFEQITIEHKRTKRLLTARPKQITKL